MISISNDHQIFKPVIMRIAIDVMYVLVAIKLAINAALHQMAMNSDLFALHHHRFIGMWRLACQLEAKFRELREMHFSKT